MAAGAGVGVGAGGGVGEEGGLEEVAALPPHPAIINQPRSRVNGRKMEIRRGSAGYLIEAACSNGAPEYRSACARQIRRAWVV